MFFRNEACYFFILYHYACFYRGTELSTTGFGSPQTAIYEITRVTKDDEGSYSCVGRNDAGVHEERIQVFVDDYAEPIYEVGRPERPAQPERPPYSDRRDEQLFYFPVGSRAILTCLDGKYLCKYFMRKYFEFRFTT